VPSSSRNKTPKTSVIRARCARGLKRKIAQAIRCRSIDESEFIRASIAEFFANHPDHEEMVDTIRRHSGFGASDAINERQVPAGKERRA
jgi:hypothetical protein